MVCSVNEPYYIPAVRRGLRLANSRGDGYTVSLFFWEAFTNSSAFRLAYNIYFSSERDNVFAEGPKYMSLNLTELRADIADFTPGDVYYFAVRATQYDPTWFNPEFLPNADGYDGYGLKVYPETLLLSDISDEDMEIPIADIDLFPAFGVIQVGTEFIRYESKDIPNSTLIVSERGFLNTTPSLHTVDGYDGYKDRDPIIRFFRGLEEQNGFVIQEDIAINPPNNHYTLADGYKINQDILTNKAEQDIVDTNNIDFPSYDFVGWHRTDPLYILSGKCLDTYIGGEHYCADGYLGIGRQIKNLSIQDQNNQRQEVLLEQTGRPAVLFRRMWSGIVCKCVQANKEHPEHRCPHCHGTGYVEGYQQFFNPRRSDGRILVRLGPHTEDFKMEDAGLENYVIHNCWTLVVPQIRDRDFIILFDESDNETARYEVLDVTRNLMFYGNSGRQDFKAQRARKTDPIYQVRAFRNTATMPLSMNTSVGLLRGPNDVPIPHTHQIVINENVTSITQINQTTSISAGHSHVISGGVILDSLGHDHQIIL